MRILVTGATGFIGSHLVPLLVGMPETAVSILALESFSNPDISPLPPSLFAIRDQLHFVYADLRNFRLTVRALEEAAPDFVIHLAAVGMTDPFMGINTALRHNLNGTINLLRASFEKTRTTKQFIVARTSGERSNMNVYAASKSAAWNFCQMFARTQKWPIHGAMIFQAYGPGQSERNLIPAAINAAIAGQDFPMTAGTQERDWIFVKDVAAGIAAMLNKPMPPGETVELGSGKPVSIADVVQRIYQLSASLGQPRIGALPSRPGEEQRQFANTEHSFNLTGWKTAVSLPTGLQTTIKKARGESESES
ncbi:MAG: NAD-dependent epimerase/dehydratase family protein [Chloroflexi bacterium]|nr:MAG: NAD-dependent epimerase/dehydratase family protein [Chloroflexota bacterium]